MSLYEDLDQEIYEALERIAYQKTKPFCYSCYRTVGGSHCKSCHSDDNMRLLQRVGVEWGLCRIRHKPYYPESRIMLNLSVDVPLGRFL